MEAPSDPAASAPAAALLAAGLGCVLREPRGAPPPLLPVSISGWESVDPLPALSAMAAGASAWAAVGGVGAGGGWAAGLGEVEAATGRAALAASDSRARLYRRSCLRRSVSARGASGLSRNTQALPAASRETTAGISHLRGPPQSVTCYWHHRPAGRHCRPHVACRRARTATQGGTCMIVTGSKARSQASDRNVSRSAPNGRACRKTHTQRVVAKQGLARTRQSVVPKQPRRAVAMAPHPRP